MPFMINLASENVTALKRIKLALIAASAGLLGLLALTVMDAAATRQQLGEERLRTAELSERRQSVEERLQREGLVLTEEGRAAMKAQVDVANQMIQQRLFSWSGLLLELERATPPGVSLLGVQPQPSTRTVTLKGEALTLSQLTSFVIKLEESPTFGDVFLADQKGQPGGTAGFTLHARY